MKNKEKPHPQDESIKWHPAFFEALQLELLDYKQSLEFLYEFQLTAEPLRIDTVIIKKPPTLTINKNFARIFREFNLAEYKSPDDYLSVNDFYKVYGYACLYAALSRVPITSLTLTFVLSRYSRGLFNHLTQVRHYLITEPYPGIHQVRGDILPIQIIESKKLLPADNLWLKGLAHDLDLESTKVILERSREKGKDAPLGAYLDVILKANSEKIREVLKMGNLTIDAVLEEAGYVAKYEARGEARGEVRGEARGEARGKARGEAERAAEIARDLLNMGWTVEQTAKISRLPLEKVQSLSDTLHKTGH